MYDIFETIRLAEERLNCKIYLILDSTGESGTLNIDGYNFAFDELDEVKDVLADYDPDIAYLPGGWSNNKN